MDKTFIPVKQSKKQGLTIATVRSLVPKKGDIGIEIECEGRRLPMVGISIDQFKEGKRFREFWSYHPDGSLRGAENGEYVLNHPIKFEEVPEALEALWRLFEVCKTKLDDSNRTSTHVHLNVQNFHVNRLTSLLALYIIFEDILTTWCGDHRVGNLFCLRAKDAPAMLQSIRSLINNDFAGGIPDGLHYSGMNVHAIAKYGSLEFRSLRGTQEFATILQWCNVLRRLYDISADFKDPREICYLFSGNGPSAFFETILGDCAPFIRDGIPFSEQEIRQSMYEGIRLCQDICYCRDWSLFEEVKLSKDPFGRSLKKVMQSLQHYEETDAAQEQYQEPYDGILNTPHHPQTITWAPAPAAQGGINFGQAVQPAPFTDMGDGAGPAPNPMTEQQLEALFADLEPHDDHDDNF